MFPMAAEVLARDGGAVEQMVERKQGLQASLRRILLLLSPLHGTEAVHPPRGGAGVRPGLS